MDLALAIEYLVPAAKYSGSVTANTKAAYEKIVWKDARPMPAWVAVSAAWLEIEAEPKPMTESGLLSLINSGASADDKIKALAEYIGLK